jgi:integrase
MYRVSGKAVMETIGTTMVIPNVADARDRARQSMIKARSGIHPVEERRAEQKEAAKEAEANELTYSRLVELFISNYAVRHQKPATVYETKRLLGRAKGWADWPARNIKKGDVLVLLDDIADHRQRKRQGAGKQPLGEAKAVQGCLGTFFRWAVGEDHIQTNPMTGIRGDRFGKSVDRDRVLTEDEIVAFWRSCEAIGWPFGPIGKLLLLTAQREGEVAGCRWSELDLERNLWSLPGERTKNKRPHLVHLSPQVMEIINQLPRIQGDLVFTTTGSTVVSGFSNAKKNLDAAMRVELEKMDRVFAPWVWHDLRRTATTVCAEDLKIPPHITDKVLNHISGTIKGVARVYNRSEYLEERKAALDTWGRYVERLVQPSTDSTVNVVELRR